MIRRTLTVVALLACAAGVTRVEAQRAHFGLRGGYNFDIEEGSLGAQLHMPLSSSIELYPSFDYYFVNTGNLLGISGDLKFRTPGAPLYFGGGLNVLTGDGNSDTGFDLFGGLETRYGQTHPFVEARALFHDSSALQLLFGLNVTLY
jgi:hypothetical protein